MQLGEHIWWGGDFKSLIEKLKLNLISHHAIRFFLGYSGWSSGQLSNELSENTWIICKEKIDQKILENTPDELWRALLKNMGGEFKVIANYPLDPRLN